jgi:CRP-like cAMP-binding protein
MKERASMSVSGYEQLARYLRQLSDIPDAEIAKAMKIFKPVSAPKGNFLLRAGEVPRTLGFVVSGVIRLFFVTPDGHERTRSFRIENSFVASYSALLLGEPSRLFLQALEPTSLLITPYSAYQELTAGHLCWQIMDRKLAQMLFIRQEQRECELLLDDATTRYLKFRAEYPGLEDRVKQHHIASYLGITPVTLSRIRSQLSRS